MKNNRLLWLVCAGATVLALEWPARAQDPTSVLEGVYTEAQADRGMAVYAKSCASCHGPELAGGETAPALSGGDFSTDWDGLSVGDLFERIRGSMPQNAPGSLSAQENADVLAFLLSANKFPAGNSELPKDLPILKTINYELKKGGR